MEDTISITTLNDFIFCPVSIYFHSVDSDIDKMLYQSDYQINGTHSHEAIDNQNYSDKKDILQGVSVYCDKYNLMGKIDIFDISNGILTERKRQIKNIYDGYIFQLYSQYFALVEMGYIVNVIRFYSMVDNKVYNIRKPEEDDEMLLKFENTINELNSFVLTSFKQTNVAKCNNCIYEPLCSYSIKNDNK